MSLAVVVTHIILPLISHREALIRQCGVEIRLGRHARCVELLIPVDLSDLLLQLFIA
jgi:hypothetical protein